MRQNSKQSRPFRPDNIQKFKLDKDSTLIEAVTAILSDHTATKIKSMLRHDQFAVNGSPSSQFNRPVKSGDELEINFDHSFIVFKNPRIRLVYEDDDIMIVDKGYGILSTGTEHVKEGTVFSIMRSYVKHNNHAAHIFIVHRLDRDTSGLMIIAKTEVAQQALLNNWSNMIIDRKYVAVVEGVMEKDADVVKSYLTENNQFEVYSTNDPSAGKLATTSYRTIKRGSDFSLIELALKVGHKNQIRVHMKDIGHPVSGDRKYGAQPNAIHRLALHASTLHFVHPVTRKEMNFETPIPPSFLSMVKK
jgi:23S rRNA pseudouridine1911/1915/1917 synthase